MASLKHPPPYGPIAIALYMLSLALPAIVSIHHPLFGRGSHDELMFGFQCLLIGWFTLPWYANLALWLAGITLAFDRPTAAAVLSIVAIALSLTTFLYVGTYVRAPHVGYVAWLASMIVVLIAACTHPRVPAVPGDLGDPP